MKKKSLRFRMMVTGLSVVIIPLLILLLLVRFQGNRVSGIVREEMIKEGFNKMEAQLELVLHDLGIANVLLKEDVDSVLVVAEQELAAQGGLVIKPENGMTEWEATNQYTERSVQISLPKVKLGNGSFIDAVRSFEQSVPIVDRIGELTGDTATLFQRMNDEGDMLRIATNVNNGGVRAVGTYIPATNPDGKPNPVISEVLAGKTFMGRAFVVDQWYITTYKPIFDASRKVIGILYVGKPQSVASEPILNRLVDIKIGKTGYPYILNTRGKDAGRYVLSAGRKRDGEIILDARDSDGNLFIRTMVEKAPHLGTNQYGQIRYPWKNQGDTVARDKVVLYAYFPAWDWLVGVGAYEDEFYETVRTVEGIFSKMVLLIGLVVLISTIVSGTLFTLFTRGLVNPIEQIIKSLTNGSQESTNAAAGVASASQSLAEGSSEQAASLEEAQSSMESMKDLVNKNNEIAKQTREETTQSNKDAQDGVVSMKELLKAVRESSRAVESMGEVISQIKSSSDAVSKIIKTIDNIAFQTNILALNASVEAARAGEAGAGFAVVAEEVSNLAKRAATAARETSTMINESIERSESGVKASNDVAIFLEKVEETSNQANQMLGAIADSIARINASMEVIENNSAEQHSGISEITDGISQINDVTQQNAASAEETASASEQLSAQAHSLQEIVEDLNGLVYGSKHS